MVKRTIGHWANDPLNAGIDIFGGVDSKKVKEDK